MDRNQRSRSTQTHRPSGGYRQQTGAHIQEGTLPTGRQPAESEANARRRDAARRRKATRGGMKRRRRRTRGLMAFMVLILVLGGGLIAMNVLFRVENFRLENMDKTQPADTGVYTREEILSALDIPLGGSILGFSVEEKARAAQARLPELDTLEILRSLPDTIVVRVEPAEAAYCVETSTGWAVLSRGCRVMRLEAAQDRDLVLLEGLPVNLAQPGSKLQMEEPAANGAEAGQTSPSAVLEELLACMEREGLAPRLTSIWMEDISNMSFLYDNRIRVELGTVNSLDYKMQLAGYLLRNENGDALNETDTGTLDCSHIAQSGKISPVFSPDSPLPTATPTPVPEQDAAG